MKQLVVHKYGGATLSTSEKIKEVAHFISKQHHQGYSIIVIVSAMGDTTNALIQMAKEVSAAPPQRELDMLISTGERISMALLSIALEGLSVPAISFTGSQAGIMTSNIHQQALIQELKPFRVQEALEQNKVVVVAGFQGVSPLTKEITTLGRGGSDTSAVAFANFFKCPCYILKEVPGVFSADPKLLANSKIHAQLNYQQLLNMTYYGAKVLHYRSVELAYQQKIPLYINRIDRPLSDGTYISEHGDPTMMEQESLLALNVHKKLVILKPLTDSEPIDPEQFFCFLEKEKLSSPQIFKLSPQVVYLTGPDEFIEPLMKNKRYKADIKCLITATVTGGMSIGFLKKLTEKIKPANPEECWMGPMSLSWVIEVSSLETALNLLS